jgi:APA family basic amino acid/polyamine antiporter
VAVGWSGYLVGLIESAGVHLPPWMLSGPHAGGIINLPAVLVSVGIAGLLMAGTRESATVNILLVIIKLAALAVFVVVVMPSFDSANLDPFMPYGFGSTFEAGEKRGVMAAAAIVFFAFYGFDAVATSAEETRNPGRDLTIGIIGSMAISTTIYILVAVAAVGAVSYTVLGGSPEPLALALRTLGHPVTSWVVASAAIVALPSVILVMMYGQSRIFFVMARDGLLPRKLANVSKRGTPVLVTGVTCLFVSLIAAFFDVGEIAALANAGTLLAFIAVGACLMVLRRRAPDLPRVFRCPAPYLIGSLAVLGCIYLLVSLPTMTLVRFVIWNAIGLVVYFVYSRARSLVRIGKPVVGI